MAEISFTVKALMMLHDALVFSKQVFLSVFCIPEALSYSLITLCMSAAHMLHIANYTTYTIIPCPWPHLSFIKQLKGHNILAQCYLHVSHRLCQVVLMTFILYLRGFWASSIRFSLHVKEETPSSASEGGGEVVSCAELFFLLCL